MTKLSPIESEFSSTEDAEAHDAWFRAKVQTALASVHPSLHHDDVMAEARQLLEQKRDATARLAD